MFTSGPGARFVRAAHYERGVTPQHMDMELPCPDGTNTPTQVMTFDGAPLYVHDLNRTIEWRDGKPGALVSCEHAFRLDGRDPPIATHIWFFAMGAGNLHGIMPERARNIIARSTILADGSTLVYHVLMAVALALGSAGALAVVKNATMPREAYRAY